MDKLSFGAALKKEERATAHKHVDTSELNHLNLE